MKHMIVDDMAKLTIALAQMDVRVGRPEENLETVRALAAQAHAAHADMLLLPELWLHGYDLERARDWAAPLDEGGFAHMASLARRYKLYLAGTSLERHAKGVSNTAVFFAPDGKVLGVYRKVHLFRPMHEDQYLIPGDHAVQCETPWGAIGLTICYDLRFPELFRSLALSGVVLFLIPAQWPIVRLDAWLTLARARAIENEVFVATCNRVGWQGETHFAGRSRVIDPWGHVLAEGSDEAQLVVAQIDFQELALVRRFLPVYEDRRPEVYGALQELGEDL